MTDPLATRYKYVLAIVLLGGLLLRLWGIDFGLPYLFHPDEGFEIQRALQLGTGSFDFERKGKGGYYYLLFLEYGAFFAIGFVSGMFSSANDFAELYITDPSYFYLIGRVTSAFIGTATVYFLFKLTARLATVEAGLLAAALLAVNPLHGIQSHYVVVDVPLVFLTVYAFYLMSGLQQQSTLKYYLWIGAIIAAATATKLPGIVLIIPFVFAHLWAANNLHRNGLLALFDKRLLWSAVAFVIVFAIGNPAAIVNFSDYIQIFQKLLAQTPAPEASTLNEVASAAQESTSSHAPNRFLFYLTAVASTITYLGVLLALAGVVIAGYQKRLHFINMFIFSLIFYGAISAASTDELVFQRYVLPFIPLLLGLAAYAIMTIYAQVKQRMMAPAAKGLLGMVMVVISASPLYASVNQNIEFGLPDTRELSADWFRDNIEQGSKVMLEGSSARAFTFTVPLRPSKEQLKQIIKEFRDNGQKGKAYYFSIDKDIEGVARYHLEFFNFRELPDLATIESESVEYLVVRPTKKNNSTAKEPNNLIKQLDESEQFKLLKEFAPVPGKTTGPHLLIYQVTQS